MSETITQLSIKALLSSGDHYLIPMYQRNYAWEEGEITQLIQDVIDYMPTNKGAGKNYYIGTLVVFRQPDRQPIVYETIDGQQRLTTLSLLASYFKNKQVGDCSWYDTLRIDFENRPYSSKTFKEIFKDNVDGIKKDELNSAILNGYRLIEKILPQKLSEHRISDTEFADYLFQFVQIMRVMVPGDTELNHYFEIMNSRGEQLEKHEILKAKMLEILQNGIDDPLERQHCQNCLHRVWEACAEMEKYVQLAFTPDQRNKLFGEKDWGRLDVKDFEELKQALAATQDNQKQSSAQSIIDIIRDKNNAEKAGKVNQDDELPERFNSVINFPNFLLHVLRVRSKKDIPLDDKRLISTFEKYIINSEEPVKRVKQFTYSLLKCKYLFDQYIIKREFIKGTDSWSLKCLKWTDGGEKSRSGRAYYINTFSIDEMNDSNNRQVLMLLAAFHVSTPTLVYKHWLNAALYHLYWAKTINADVYLAYLQSVANSFVFDRFLAAKDSAEYFAMIYEREGICQCKSWEQLDESRLTFRNIENNFVFNYLDYLLWVENENSEKTDSVIKSYEFTFRSSIEHYYPQNPLPGYDHLALESLDSFGNLCLISHSKNSRLSNFSPEQKRGFYKNNKIDSIKQYKMMQINEKNNWDAESIAKHYDAMKEVLVNGLNGASQNDGNASI
jgi:hypothetical protein